MDFVDLTYYRITQRQSYATCGIVFGKKVKGSKMSGN